MNIRKFSTYLVEALNMKEINEEINDTYKELKEDLLDLINKTLEESDKKDITKEDLNDFMNKYVIAGKDVDMIDELIEDNDIFNFYLKHQSDFDELLNDTGYMSKSPKDNNVFSLYDVIIDGTKQGIIEIIEILQSELFK